jgi:hypothetical protein
MKTRTIVILALVALALTVGAVLALPCTPPREPLPQEHVEP